MKTTELNKLQKALGQARAILEASILEGAWQSIDHAEAAVEANQAIRKAQKAIDETLAQLPLPGVEA